MDLRSLWVAMGEHLQAWFAPVPGSVCETGTGGFSALTGLPIPELNTIGIHEAVAVSDVLERTSGCRTLLEHPALLLVSGAIAAAAEPVTRRRGFLPGGIAPLMRLSADDVPAGDTGFEVFRLGPDDLDTYTRAASEPFSMPPHVIRHFGAATLGASSSRVYALADKDEVVSTVTFTGDGGTTGIWAMGTRSSCRRKGYGSDLLAEAMRRERDRGASSFFLYSSEAGYPLYDRLGFKIVDAISLWIRLGVLDLRTRSIPGSPELVRGRW
ncbi:MAG TPA: GNAT family N-acetyltransferase [Actinomycetota bacterium]|nr:GNAT family N-acetyltransferase [Actinomycetota bacterium]